MRLETQHTEESSGHEGMIHPSTYSQAPWHSTSPYTHSPYGDSPMNEYAHFPNYISHGMPSEAISGLPTSLPQPQVAHTGTMTHHHLPMLTTTGTWPSELTAHAQTSAYAIPSNQLVETSSSETCGTKPSDKARRTLTFEQKRAICLLHEKNPKMRQADIGDQFKVERSTVSKVLRNKEQYLRGDVEKDTSSKRNTGKNPNFERTFANYIKNQKGVGIFMSDEDIMNKAHKYARASPNQKAILAKLTPEWLRKFKSTYYLDSPGPVRRASEPTIPERLSMTARFQSISPSSPSGQTSPLSVSPSDDGTQSRGGYGFPYRQFASQSDASLTDNPASSFSSELISPAGVFGYSPDTHSSAFRLDSGFESDSKLRSSYHAMELEYTTRRHNESADSELRTPRNIPVACKQESPVADAIASAHIEGLDGKRSKLSSRPKAQVSRAAPSPEDAQRAAATLLKYLQNLGQSGHDSEYLALMQISQKLHIQPNQPIHPDQRGLARIVESDSDLVTAGAH
ncbi:hypothetical protein NLG97_g6874 [Lecanicillium saksenae]|uniref:Uncharacterized protein n=1 Tax=Lecanicillium saksenae TaxID=468837 RepID=A0ACC1QRL6_9HYPO|nr:hypothetical protein NLG97_g6874 [Lecanicillium saksenae]